MSVLILTKYPYDDVAEVVLRGRVDATVGEQIVTSAEIALTGTRTLVHPVSLMVLDMSGVHFIDADGLRILETVAAMAEEPDVEVLFLGPSEEVRLGVTSAWPPFAQADLRFKGVFALSHVVPG